MCRLWSALYTARAELVAVERLVSLQLDTTTWPGDVDNYVDALVWLVGELLTDPKHFFVPSPSRSSADS